MSICNTWTLKNKCISNVGRSISLGSNPGLPIRHCTSATPGLRYKNLGKSGLRISNVGLGTWSIFAPSVSEEQAETIIKLAVDSGINIFDLSEAHSGKFVSLVVYLKKKTSIFFYYLRYKSRNRTRKNPTKISMETCKLCGHYKNLLEHKVSVIIW